MPAIWDNIVAAILQNQQDAYAQDAALRNNSRLVSGPSTKLDEIALKQRKAIGKATMKALEDEGFMNYWASMLAGKK